MKINNSQKNRTLNELIEDCNTFLTDYKDIQCEELKIKINNLQEELIVKNKQIVKSRKFDTFFLLIIFIIMLFSFGLNYITQKENENLKGDIVEKKNIIEKLQWTDSVFNQIMGIDTSSVQNFVVHKNEKGKVVTYPELVKQNEELQQEVYRSTSKVSDLQWSDDWLKIIMPLKIKKGEKSITYMSRNGKIITYEDLSKEKKESVDNAQKTLDIANSYIKTLEQREKEYYQKSDSLQALKRVLYLIQKNYDISYTVKIEENMLTTSISAKELDSALVLLPHFRDRLTLDEAGKIWTIDLDKPKKRKTK